MTSVHKHSQCTSFSRTALMPYVCRRSVSLLSVLFSGSSASMSSLLVRTRCPSIALSTFARSDKSNFSRNLARTKNWKPEGLNRDSNRGPSTYLFTYDDIHPARAQSASMAFAASRTAGDQVRRSWARSIASDVNSLFHLRMPTTASPMSRTKPCANHWNDCVRD